MPAKVVVRRLKGDLPGTAEEVQAVCFRADDGDGVDQGAPVLLPPAVATALTQPVQSLPSPQEADVVNSAFFQPGDYAIVDAGTERQEVVRIAAVPSAGSLSAVFMRNHPSGAKVALVSASVSKTFRVDIDEAPETSLARVCLRRADPLPEGVFDQFRIPVSYVPGSAEPWHSGPTSVFYAVPSDAPYMVAAGPWTARTEGAAVFEIQWLFTAAARIPFHEVRYRVSWDEA